MNFFLNSAASFVANRIREVDPVISARLKSALQAFDAGVKQWDYKRKRKAPAPPPDDPIKVNTLAD